MRDDVTLRHSLMTPGFIEQHQRDLLALNYEAQQKGNSGYYLPARIELEIRDTNERAQALYDACCEVWENHGLKRTRAFFRAVFDNCLQLLFGTRRGAIAYDLQLRDTRMGTPGRSSAAQGSLTRRMGQLTATWNQKLEKETRDCETRERVERRHAALRPITPVVLTSRTPLAPSPLSGKTPRKRRTQKKLAKAEMQRRAAIFAAIQSNLEGLKYCKELDRRRLRIPSAWISDGCPDTYANAYNSTAEPCWRKKIQDEKYRYGRKYKQTSPTQRENLIQQVPSARATRQ